MALPSGYWMPHWVHCVRGSLMARSAWSHGQVLRHAHLLDPRLVRAPAEVLHVVRRRADDVVVVGEQVDTPVAVIVDGVVEIARRQELRLPDLTGPRADHAGRAHVAAIDDLQRRDQLLGEHLAAAAIIGEGDEGRQNGELAHARAEVALESPEARDDRSGHAEFRFRALERGAMLGDLALARLHAVRRRQLGLEVEEAHDEDGALLAISPDDLRAERNLVDDGDRLTADAARRRFLAEARLPRFEALGVAAVLLRRRMRRALLRMRAMGGYRRRRLRDRRLPRSGLRRRRLCRGDFSRGGLRGSGSGGRRIGRCYGVRRDGGRRGHRLRRRLAHRLLLRRHYLEGGRRFDLGGGNAGRGGGKKNGRGRSRAESHNVHYASFGVFLRSRRTQCRSVWPRQDAGTGPMCGISAVPQ